MFLLRLLLFVAVSFPSGRVVSMSRRAILKLHKVSHQFSFGLRPCKIVRTVNNIEVVRNVFISVAPIRRDFHKKLHKFLHLFLLHTFGA